MKQCSRVPVFHGVRGGKNTANRDIYKNTKCWENILFQEMKTAK